MNKRSIYWTRKKNILFNQSIFKRYSVEINDTKELREMCILKRYLNNKTIVESTQYVNKLNSLMQG